MPEKNRVKTDGNRSQPAGDATRWAKGQSGNPKGRPRGVPNRATRDIREISRALTLGDPKYVARLQQQLRAGTCPPAIEVRLLEYAYGRPVERVEAGGEMTLAIPSLVSLLSRIEAKRARVVGSGSTATKALPQGLEDDPRQQWLRQQRDNEHGSEHEDSPRERWLRQQRNNGHSEHACE